MKESFYIFNEKQNVEESDTEKIKEWCSNNSDNRVVGKDWVDGEKISTVIVGLVLSDKVYADAFLLAWKTEFSAVPPDDNIRFIMFGSRKEAEAMHANIIDALRTGKRPHQIMENIQTGKQYRLREDIRDNFVTALRPQEDPSG